MRGSNTKLLQYMEGSKTRFVIPVYQRNYEWKRENCEQLYQDLLDVARMHRSSHFLVALYLPIIPTEDMRNTWLLMDSSG